MVLNIYLFLSLFAWILSLHYKVRKYVLHSIVAGVELSPIQINSNMQDYE